MKKTLQLFFLTFSCLALGQCYTKVQSATCTIVALRTNGTLWAKGQNNNGTTGNGLQTPVTDFTQIGSGNDWSENFSVSSSHVLAVKNNGQLWAWGSQDHGACGNGTTGGGIPITPIQVGSDSDWAAVAAAAGSSLAIKTNGTLWAWGSNNFGQLGIGSAVQFDQLTPLQVGTEHNWSKIFNNEGTCFAIKTDGTLWSWGSDGSGGKLGYTEANINTTRLSPHLVNNDTNWSTTAMNFFMTLALKTDGTLWCWGLTSSMLFGDGTTGPRFSNIPIQIGTDTDWKQISISPTTCVALKQNKTRWGWGYNTSNALGDGTATNRLVPTSLDAAADWVFVALDSQTCGGNAIKESHSLYHWGANFSTPTPQATPIQDGVDCALGNESFFSQLFTVYPNPTGDFVFIDFKKEPAKFSLKILNTMGQILIHDDTDTNNDTEPIDLRSLPSGIYYLSIESAQGTYSQKILKQ